jgi:hypothetical protein
MPATADAGEAGEANSGTSGAAGANDSTGGTSSQNDGGAGGNPTPHGGASGAQEGGTPGGGEAGEAGGTSETGGSSGTAGGGSGGTPGGTAGVPNAGAGGGAVAGSAGNGGSAANGGSAGAQGGAGGSGATAGAGGTGGAPCSFTVNVTTSTQIPTVGIVEWSTTLPDLADAKVVYTLEGARAGIINRGGVAPADPGDTHHRTLLLGLKPESSYELHIEAESRTGATCASDDYTLATGVLAGAPSITREVLDATAQEPGFIIAPGGVGSRAPVAIVDADGEIVWSSPAPESCSRARLDSRGENLWMLGINPANRGGDMRAVSLDGALEQKNLPGLERAHHDFTLLDNGNLAVFVWASSGFDPESDLVEIHPDGSLSQLFRIGTRQYPPGQSAFGGSANSYHCNSIDYHPNDDTFTIGDRNPNLFVKVSRGGEPLWQFGGSCQAARAPICVPGTWRVNHGHELLDDGTFVFFSNEDFGDTGAPSNIQHFRLDMANPPSATPLREWSGSGGEHSDTLGDVQLLPNGNTLVTFSNNGTIYELDEDWNVVQILSASSFGYSEWRATLYARIP